MTYTLDQLTSIASHTHDITSDAAEASLTEDIAQIETLENRTIDEDDISDEDGQFLLESLRQAQRSGDLGTVELATLEATVIKMDALTALEGERNIQVRDALKAGARVADIVDITGLSRTRVYQIRDGK